MRASIFERSRVVIWWQIAKESCGRPVELLDGSALQLRVEIELGAGKLHGEAPDLLPAARSAALPEPVLEQRTHQARCRNTQLTRFGEEILVHFQG